MKKIFLIAQMVTLTFLLSACYTNVLENDFSVNKEALMEVCLDPGNPLLANLTTKDNKFHVYGEKSEMAYPMRMTEILVERNTGDKYDVLFESYLPCFLSTPEKVKFYLDWSSSTFATLRIVNGVTGEQVMTTINMLAGRSTLRSKAMASLRTIPVSVFLNNQGSLADGYCFIDVMGMDGRFLTRCKGERVSKGVYEVQIPVSLGSDNEDRYYTEESCMSITNLLGEMSSASYDVFYAIERKVMDMDQNGEIAPMVVSAAYQLRTVFDDYNASINGIRSNDNIPFYELYKKVESYNSPNVRLSPFVYAIPYDIEGTSIEVDLGQGYIDPIEIRW